MTRHERLLNALQNLSERELTERLLVPLFRALGFTRVEYSGGPTEEGKDLICWRRDELDEVELAVAQVKKFKLTRPADDNHSLQTILNQLSQAADKPLPNPETQSYHLPTVVYLITPFPLETLVLQSRFELLPSLRRCRIKIVDGHKLTDLLESKLRATATRLLGTGSLFADAIACQLTNEVLLRALDTAPGRSVETFYTEIDLALGQLSSQLLFQATYRPKIEACQFTERAWKEFLDTRKLLLQATSVDIARDPISLAEAKYAALREIHLRWQDGHNVLLQKHGAACDEKEIAAKRVDEATEMLRLRSCVAFRSFESPQEIWQAVRYRQSLELALRKRRTDAASEESHKRIPVLMAEIAELDTKLGEAFGTLEPLLSRLEAASQVVNNSNISIEASVASEPALYFEINLDSSCLATYLLRAREKLMTQIRMLNSYPVAHEELRAFLIDCQEALLVLQRIARLPELLKALDADFGGSLINSEATRLNIGVQKILDTGLNLLVLGEAGAGKTTSLQMYAHRKMTADSSGGRLVLFVPMGRLVRYVGNLSDSGPPPGTYDRLLAALSRFLSHLGLEVSERDLESELFRGAVVLLDGIDEVGDRWPSILDEINNIAFRFPMVQWVLSARTSGRLGFEIGFVPVTLLPFSDAQRREFACRWFNDEQSDVAGRIIEHLAINTEIASVVRNPLLMTILCVLAEYQVPLPSTEIRLYKDRFDLLTGRYDLHKEVVRLRTRQETLLSLAQKLAFRLHRGRRREVDTATMRDWSVEILEPDTGLAGSLRAMEELVDPCNILIPMSLDGKLGFGHLRYQEYLSARELLENRSVSVMPLLEDRWWRDVLIFLAKLSPSLSWLLARLKIEYAGRTLPPVVAEMIAEGPPREREGLAWILASMERS